MLPCQQHRPPRATTIATTTRRHLPCSLSASLCLGAIAVLTEAPPVANGFLLPSAAIFVFDVNSLAVQGLSTTRGRRGYSVSLRGKRRSGGKAIAARVSSSALRSSSVDGDDDDDDDVDLLDTNNGILGRDWRDDEDGDDGLGVTQTVKPKKNPFDPYEEKNRIFERAVVVQEWSDELAPPDKFDKYKRKPGGGDGNGATKGEDDDDLGMGISMTATASGEKSSSIAGDVSLAKRIGLLMGADEDREMESLAAKDALRGKMTEQGFSPEQVAAYVGDDLSVTKESERDRRDEETMKKFTSVAFEDVRLMQEELDKRGVVMSSALVPTDEKGEPFQERFVYVDEYTCIGCTHCSHTAPGTFFMEPEHGRARVYQQDKDTQMAISDAILTCPVDCIHFVGWGELKKLESEREGIEINFKAKLVGNDHDNVRNGQQIISGNQGMRCENCPSKGCYNCPMYGVGFNPEYVKRKAEMKLKNQDRLRAEEEKIRGSRSAEL